MKILHCLTAGLALGLTTTGWHAFGQQNAAAAQAGQAGAGQAGAGQAGAGQAGAGQAAGGQANAAQVGAGQANAGQAGAGQAAGGQANSAQLGAGQANAGQAGAGQAGAGQAAGGQANAAQLGAGQANAGQLGAGQPGAGQLGAGQQGAGPQGLWAEGYPQNPWFADRALQEQLRLTPQQLERLQNIYRQNWERSRVTGLGGANSNLPAGNAAAGTANAANPKAVNPAAAGVNEANLTEEQLLARRQQMAQEFNRDFTGALPEVFPEEAQRQRFQQLMVQYQGLNAFDDPGLIQRLELDAEQRQKINKLQYEWRRQMARLNRGGSTSRPSDFNWNDFFRRTNHSIEEILTPDQLRIWQGLRGENYEFPETVYFPTGVEAKAQR